MRRRSRFFVRKLTGEDGENMKSRNTNELKNINKSKNTILYGSLLLIQCLLWGVGNPVMKIGLSVIPPLFCLTVRYILAFLIFMPFLAKRVFANMSWKHLIRFLIIAAFTAASFITCAFALIYTTATNAGFLMGTAVIFTPLLSCLILKSKIDKKHFVPIVIVTAGLFLLCSGGGGFSLGPGEVLALLCAISGAGMLAFCSEPIFTAIASYIMLHEVLSVKGFIGAVLIIVSIVAASLLPND